MGDWVGFLNTTRKKSGEAIELSTKLTKLNKNILIFGDLDLQLDA